MNDQIDLGKDSLADIENRVAGNLKQERKKKIEQELKAKRQVVVDAKLSYHAALDDYNAYKQEASEQFAMIDEALTL